MRVTGSHGKIYEMENKEMASGGEGKIYKIIGISDQVAKIYERMLRGLEQVKKRIYLGAGNAFEIEKIFHAVLEDHPEIFYVDGGQAVGGIWGVVMLPRYLYDAHMIERLRWACFDQRNRILKGPIYTNPMMIALRVHNLLGMNVEYRENGKTAHSIVGPMLQMEGVCEGYAKAMKYILDGYEIPCIVVEGYAKSAPDQPEEPHAWVLAYINAHWRHIDPTFDSTISSKMFIREDYFQLTDVQITKDHRWDTSRYPSAD